MAANGGDGDDVRHAGIYARREELDDARAAYVVAARRGTASSFGAWLDAAALALAEDQPAVRAETLARVIDTDPGERGYVRRDVTMTQTTWDAVEGALRADGGAGIPPYSRSAFLRAAMVTETERVRGELGGTLPPAPRRLPPQIR